MSKFPWIEVLLLAVVSGMIATSIVLGVVEPECSASALCWVLAGLFLIFLQAYLVVEGVDRYLNRCIFLQEVKYLGEKKKRGRCSLTERACESDRRAGSEDCGNGPVLALEEVPGWRI